MTRVWTLDKHTVRLLWCKKISLVFIFWFVLSKCSFCNSFCVYCMVSYTCLFNIIFGEQIFEIEFSGMKLAVVMVLTMWILRGSTLSVFFMLVLYCYNLSVCCVILLLNIGSMSLPLVGSLSSCIGQHKLTYPSFLP